MAAMLLEDLVDQQYKQRKLDDMHLPFSALCKV